MKYLLDTHAIIWIFEDAPQISSKVKDIIRDTDNKIFISSVSLWEIAIKVNLNKLDLKIELHELLMIIKNSEIVVIQIEDAFLEKLSSLPYIHKDPFDRLIVSSAIIEDLIIITSDENIRKYGVSWEW